MKGPCLPCSCFINYSLPRCFFPPEEFHYTYVHIAPWQNMYVLPVLWMDAPSTLVHNQAPSFLMHTSFLSTEKSMAFFHLNGAESVSSEDIIFGSPSFFNFPQGSHLVAVATIVSQNSKSVRRDSKVGVPWLLHRWNLLYFCFPEHSP